jgi:isopenicillin N synthase-like dioxygenase
MPLELADALASQQGIEKTKKLSVNEIPIIDVGRLVKGEPGSAVEVAEQFLHAFTTIGFCYITNHGVPQRLVDRALGELPRFFNLPLEEKLKIPINTNQRGYLQMHKQTQIHGRKPNRSESFIFGLDLPADDPDRRAGLPMHDTNRWPEGLPGFRETLEEYWRAVVAIGPKLLRALALAMKQPEDFFVPFYTKPDSLLRCVTYPGMEGDFDGQFGAGPHTDNGTLTILAQDDIGGLQLRTLAGDWIDAPVIPGTFIINIGDMIVRWTNGAFRSTPHRVVCSRRTRCSLPLFFFPDYRTVIEPLPEFVSADKPPRFKPVVWGEYVRQQFAAAYDHFKEKP